VAAITYSTNVVACPSVVEALAFDHQLHVELVFVRDAKEAGSKVLHGLDHPVFRLGSEDWQLAGSREVVEQVCPPGQRAYSSRTERTAIEVSRLDAQLEVLLPTEWGQDFLAQLVGPVIQELERSGCSEAISGSELGKVGGER
jgi:hypothetical protein